MCVKKTIPLKFANRARCDQLDLVSAINAATPQPIIPIAGVTNEAIVLIHKEPRPSAPLLLS
jgi:hypothetical protein